MKTMLRAAAMRTLLGLWSASTAIAASGAAEPEWTTVKVPEAGLTFSVPAAAERKVESGRIRYVSQTDGGETVFELSLVQVADPAAFRAKWNEALDAMRDGAVGNLKGKLLEEKPVDFAGLTGRELFLRGPNGFLVTMRTHLVDKWLVMSEVDQSEKSNAGPATIKRFLDSVKVAPPPVAVAPPSTVPSNTAPSPPHSGEKPPADAASHAAFVDALAARDAQRLYAMMHPDLKKLVDPPLMQAFVEIVAEELGPVAEKQTDGLRLVTEETATSKTVRGSDKVGFKNGAYEVRTNVVDGKLMGFNLAAPQLTKLDQKFYSYFNRLLSTAPDRLRPAAEYYGNRGAGFTKALLEQGVKTAWDQLDPRVQTQLPLEKISPDLERIRAKYAPLGKMELESIRFVADAQGTFEEMDLLLSLERPGKKPALAEFSFKFDGFRAVMIGYSYREEGEAAAPAPPPKATSPNPPPAAPVP